MLKIAKDFSMPLDAVTQTFAILAKRRVGKTYTASVIAEEFCEAGLPFVALDPTGAWWGLRSSKDGKKAGYPVIIIGGAHGDIPLEFTAGKLIAEFIVENPGFYVIDLSQSESDAEQDRFATAFASRLYRLKDKHRDPLHLFVDEADAFIPQKPMENQKHLLHAFNALVRRGGIRGIGVTLITQRPAIVNKDVLNMTETIIALQTTAPLDQDAVIDWVKRNATKEQLATFKDSFASLKTGEAWFYSPAWLEVLQLVHIRERRTFNSSATPKVGETKIEPTKLADVDLGSLQKKMAETIEKAKADDPKELKKKIAELERELSTVQKTTSARSAAKPDPAREAELRAREKAIADSVRDLNTKISQLAKREENYKKDVARSRDRLRSIFEKVDGEIQTLLSLQVDNSNVEPLDPSKYKVAFVPSMGELTDERAPKPQNHTPPRQNVISHPVMNNGNLPEGERKVLIVAAQYSDRGGASREQIGILTGYARSSRNTYISRLSVKGYLDVRDNIFATAEGVAALGDFEILPEGRELQQWWLDRLPEGEAKILQLLIAAYPDPVTRDHLSEQTGYARSSRNTYISRMSVKRLVTTNSGGEVMASEDLF